MLPWKLVASAPIPGARAELRLLERGGEFVLRAGARELMSSREHGSEEALGELAADRLAGRAEPRVLISGLGMGYTLAGALRKLGPRARVVVAELVPAVVDWNRGVLGALAGHPLRDPRVEVRCVDVAEVLRRASGDYDAVILDVDNGPEAASRPANRWLYSELGLQSLQSALRPGGVAALWSASADPRFEKRWGRAGFRVRRAPLPESAGSPARRVIWAAVALPADRA